MLFMPEFKADFNTADKRLVKPEQLQAAANWLAGTPDLFIDWEANGLDPRKGHRPFMLGAFAPDKGAKVFDFRFLGEAGVRAVRDGLNSRKMGQRIRSFNWALEYKFCRSLGIEPGGEPWCAMLAAFAVNELRPEYGEFGPHTQKALTWHELKKEPVFAKTVKAWLQSNTGQTSWGYELVPGSLIVPYNAEDLEMGWELSQCMERQVKANGQEELVAVDSLCAQEVVLIEERGIQFNEARARQLSDQFSREMKHHYQRILNALGRGIDPLSHSHMMGLLYGELGVPLHEDIEKAGKVDDDVMEWALSLPEIQANPRAVEIIDAVREWKELHKLKDTYLMPWTYEWQEGGIIYPHLNMMGARTRRFSAASPNLQNVPARTDRGALIRECLTSRPGFETYCMDESQAEYRAFANYSNEKHLVDGYRTGGRAFDIHELVSKLLGVKRKFGKNINFGILYGMGIAKLARSLLRSKEEAKLLMNQYYQRLPRVKAFRREMDDYVRRFGYVRDAFGGRRHLKPDESYKAVNSICQMTVANLMREAMVRAGPIIRRHGGHMLLQVHDELDFELPGDRRDHVPALREIREEAMEGAFRRRFTVPLVSDCERWAPDCAHAEKMELEAA